MNDLDFRRELNRVMGDPPPAPRDELVRIYARVEARKPAPWLWPALSCALSVVFAITVVLDVKPPAAYAPGMRAAGLFDYEVTQAGGDGLDGYQALLSSALAAKRK